MRNRVWNFSGPMYQQSASDQHGRLGVAESDGVDTREHNRVQLGPKFTDVDLSSVGGTTANANAAGIIARTTGGTEQFLYVTRGTVPTKIIWDTMGLAATQPSALTERGTSVIVTKAPSGTAEITFGMAGTNYQTVTAVAAQNAADTRASGGDTFRIFGQGPDRVYGLDGQTIQGNVLASTVDMSTPSFSTLATFAADNLVPTGFAMLENLAMWGTNQGVLVLNAQFEEFFPAGGLVPADSLNCHAMAFVPFLGVIVPLRDQLRLYRGDAAYSERVGPEAYGSPNTVSGQVTGLGYDQNWVYMALRNNVTSKTYILAARPRQPGDWHYNVLSYYCIGSFTSACELVTVPSDAAGERDNPTLVVGKTSNIAYATLPRGQRPSEDSNYAYQDSADQTVKGTEVQPAEPETIESFLMPRLSNLASGRTVTVKIAFTDYKGNSDTATFGPFDTSGRLDYPIPANLLPDNLVAYQPQIVLNSTVSTSSPLVLGEDQLILRTRPTREGR